MTPRDLSGAMKSGMFQRDRLLMLDTPLGKNALTPLRTRGFARIGRNYSYTVDVASLRDDTALLSLMHQPVTLWVQQISAPFSPSTYRPVHGFVHRVAYLGGDGGLYTYQIEFSSALVFLERTHNEEGWLEKDAREIVSDVFDRYPQLRGQSRLSTSGRTATTSRTGLRIGPRCRRCRVRITCLAHSTTSGPRPIFRWRMPSRRRAMSRRNINSRSSMVFPMRQ
jgi:uncharacterized protein involved in type VI secretion and phage assembly